MSELSTQTSSSTADAALLLEVAELVVNALNLEIAAADVQADEPLYGDGLGLDSIDILEMSLAISKEYGFQLKSDDEDKTRIFSSLRNLNSYIQQRRTR